MRRRSGLRLAAAAVLAVGCAGSSSSTLSDDGDRPLPRSNITLVFDFRVGPEQAEGVAADADAGLQARVGRAAATALSERVVDQLRLIGINAQRAETPPEPNRPALLVRGDLVQVSEKGRFPHETDLGVGERGIVTRVELVSSGPGGSHVAVSFWTRAWGSRPPGIPASVDGGSKFVREFLEALDKDMENTAKEIVEQILELYVQQRWL